jgi:hypothetical protein
MQIQTTSNNITTDTGLISHDKKPNSKIYDNSMSLILVILSKLCKIENSYVNGVLDIFIDHISCHLDCFNYYISFYRLFITCPELKYFSKEYELYNNLFEFYRKIYDISLKSENNDKPKKVFPFDEKNDKKYFISKMKRNETDIIEEVENKDGELTVEKNQPSPSPIKKSKVSNINIVSDFYQVHGHDRKGSENITFNMVSMKGSSDIVTKFSNNKVPSLKLPKNTVEQHFSITK